MFILEVNLKHYIDLNIEFSKLNTPSLVYFQGPFDNHGSIET